MPYKGAVITNVSEGSIAADLGVEPGDYLFKINGEQVFDIISYHYLCVDQELQIEIVKPDGEHWLLDIEKDYGEDLGIEFAHPTFDGLKRCSNNCLFCFVQQMPKGLRKGLYVKDDDYRYSFLHGNFITLTNMKPKDWEYIYRWHLSPLYISVHTTNPDLRRKLMGNKRSGEIMDQLKELAKNGINMHTQIVLCPGLNDGIELERTVNDLSSFYPAVQSIAIVPVGLTSCREGLYPLRRVTKTEAQKIIDKIKNWQEDFRNRFDYGLVYGSDEFYILAEAPIPDNIYYDDYPQTENGIGITRLFIDEFEEEINHIPHVLSEPHCVAIATGTLIAPIMEKLVQKITKKTSNLEIKVVPVVNRFFGSEVTVAGLLTGKDLLIGLKEVSNWLKDNNGTIIIPDVMLKSDDTVFLDDMTPDMLSSELKLPVEVAKTTGRGLIEAVIGKKLK
ncbi:MAG: hypothetical protein PWP31_216 [Clostridia bacterium]|nr:hypothetical protein [Clostridia bacterium]